MPAARKELPREYSAKERRQDGEPDGDSGTTGRAKIFQMWVHGTFLF